MTPPIRFVDIIFQINRIQQAGAVQSAHNFAVQRRNLAFPRRKRTDEAEHQASNFATVAGQVMFSAWTWERPFAPILRAAPLSSHTRSIASAIDA